MTKRQVDQGYKGGPYTSTVPQLAKKEKPLYTSGMMGNQRREKRQLRAPPHRNKPPALTPPQHKGGIPTPQRPPNTTESQKITKKLQVCSTQKGATEQPPALLRNSVRGIPPLSHTKGQRTPHGPLGVPKEKFFPKTSIGAKGQGGQNQRCTPRRTPHPPHSKGI